MKTNAPEASATPVDPAPTLHDALVSVTIGGAGATVTDEEVARIFGSYLEKAIPGIGIHEISPIRTLAALNSVSATVDFTYAGRRYDAFAKAHIESNTGTSHVSSAAGVKEYENAAMLEGCGWPVVAPLKEIPYNSDYPVLLYPRVEAPTLFQLLERSYAAGVSQITRGQLATLREFEELAGKASLASLKVVRGAEAADGGTAPVQNLFRVRLQSGARIDQWYEPHTKFAFPGLESPVTWNTILDLRWNVNGITCGSTLREIIAAGRRLLSFEGEEKAAVCISHGDDHAGNVFIDEQEGAKVFDPAFAGLNPASISHLKAFFHSGIVPVAGLYYDPKLSTCSYSLTGSEMTANVSFTESPILGTHEQIAKAIVDHRIMPILEKMKELGFDISVECERIKAAMATCCFLVINVSTLLANRARHVESGAPLVGGTGEGLFPLVFLSDELRGLPQLEYLKAGIDSLA